MTNDPINKYSAVPATNLIFCEMGQLIINYYNVKNTNPMIPTGFSDVPIGHIPGLTQRLMT